ncbi:MAG TPA: hydroxyacylglutathione hydrolase [Polyangiaceae bacterium]|nr:hydroxyacylglutathione hydrolase [Polyangiaceae bacterium]
MSRPNAPFPIAGGRLTVHQLPAATDNLVWLLVAADGEAAAVDGPDAEGVLALAAERGFRFTTILNTHTHGDHVGINRDLERRGLLGKIRVVGSKKAAKDVPGIGERVDEGDTVTFAGVTAKVLLTEGHIDGHVSYVFDGGAFVGDTMFGAGCGYLFDGPPEKMHRSLARLAALPPETRVFCAHEYTLDNLRFAWSLEPENPDLARRIGWSRARRDAGGCTVPSTIGLERRTNPFLRGDSPALRARVAAAMPDRSLDSPEAVFAATRALKDRKDYKSIPDSSLPPPWPSALDDALERQ